jgi:hypothetical protein
VLVSGSCDLSSRKASEACQVHWLGRRLYGVLLDSTQVIAALIRALARIAKKS